ncbi:hypothetical protein J6590_005858 [Homalodisca vitripennis]|nr:hypothetical protein J6590_005858 [Homalodisca vitripennis]
MYTYAAAAAAGVGSHYQPAPPTYLPPHHQLAAPGLGPVPPPMPPLSPHSKRRSLFLFPSTKVSISITSSPEVIISNTSEARDVPVARKESQGLRCLEQS